MEKTLAKNLINCNFDLKLNDMDLQSRKIEFIQEFLKVQSEDVIDRLEKLLRKEILKSENEVVKPFSFDELHDRVNQSMADSNQGKLTNNKDLLAEVLKWQ